MRRSRGGAKTAGRHRFWREHGRSTEWRQNEVGSDPLVDDAELVWSEQHAPATVGDLLQGDELAGERGTHEYEEVCSPAELTGRGDPAHSEPGRKLELRKASWIRPCRRDVVSLGRLQAERFVGPPS